MKNVKAFIVIFKKLLFIMDKRQKKTAVYLFAVIFFGAIFETIGVSAILPFVSAVLEPEQLMRNPFVENILSLFGVITGNGLVFLSAIGVISLYIIKNLYLILSAYFQSRFKGSFVKKLSCRMLESYMKRPYLYFVKMNSSDIIRGVISDVDAVNNLLDHIFITMTEILTALCIVVFLLASDFVMAMGVIVVVMITFFAIIKLVKKRLKMAGIMSRESAALRYRYGQEAISGIKEISVLQRRKYFVDRYNEASEEKRKVDVTLSFITAMPTRIIEAVCISGILVMVCVRILMGVEVNSFVPQLASFAVAAFRVLPSIAKINNGINALVFYKPCLEEVYDNLLEAQQLDLGSELIIQADSESTTSYTDKITVENVTWSYGELDKEVIKGLNIEIRKGQFVGIIGESGSGKTTLTDLLLGLFKPQQGGIFIDGKNILEIPSEWSKIVGYVPQTIYLIDDTVRKNIAFGVYDDDIDDNKVWSALEKAQLKNMIEGLENSLNTIIGERGIRFSGGQKQRLAIARALYNEPEILILDEATSALDNETENAVMESIDALKGKTTLVVVAHRLTTIKEADCLYEIENGKAIKKDKKEIFKSLEHSR